MRPEKQVVAPVHQEPVMSPEFVVYTENKDAVLAPNGSGKDYVIYRSENDGSAKWYHYRILN